MKEMKEKGIDTNNVFLIAFKDKIETNWVETGIKESLQENYKKLNLPCYAKKEKIDLNFLRDNDENFKTFVDAIDP